MADYTYFQVQRGSIVSDCMEETYEFINQNLEFFYHNLKDIKEAIGSDGPFTFISHEDRWSFACRVDRSELGRVAAGQGFVTEGADCPYNDIISKLDEAE